VRDDQNQKAMLAYACLMLPILQPLLNMQLPLYKNLVLVGGGHSHAIALKNFGMNPMPGVRLTLITEVTDTPYSGMLPGYVAGLYGFEDCHIDLGPLAQFAQTRMIVDRAVGIDLERNQVLLREGSPIAFDLLSLDIGSQPSVLTVPGAVEHAIAVKPISRFLKAWDEMVVEIGEKPERAVRVAIVGGGAGGVELAFNIQARLWQLFEAAGRSTSQLELHVLHRGDRLLPERHPGVGRAVERLLRRRGVKIHLNESVVEVGADRLRCESGLEVSCDPCGICGAARVFWVTQAAAAPWLKESGLATDERGFVWVNDRLQSVSHEQVFAAGDVATMVGQVRPKAGVFAVRQGQPLAENLRRVVLGEPLRAFVPQKDYLILLGTGDRRALASRGALWLPPYRLLWNWKDGIDRKFMDQFRNLAVRK
jgi:selenide, water dikinase